MSSYSFFAFAMSTEMLWGIGRRSQCKTGLIIPAGWGLELRVGVRLPRLCPATEGCCCTETKPEWMGQWYTHGFPRYPSSAVCCVFPWPETEALPLPRLSLHPGHCPPAVLCTAGASQRSVQWRQVLVAGSDTQVLKTGQGPGFDDASAKFTKAEVSLGEKTVLPTEKLYGTCTELRLQTRVSLSPVDEVSLNPPLPSQVTVK